MRKGIPLTDNDRWDWLVALRNAAVKQLKGSNAILIACSCLRRRYRDVFRVVSYGSPTIQTHFIYLKLDEEHLEARLTMRMGHYMKESMLRSQIECMEEPAQDEFDVVTVDVQRDQAAVCGDALAVVRARLNQHETGITEFERQAG